MAETRHAYVDSGKDGDWCRCGAHRSYWRHFAERAPERRITSRRAEPTSPSVPEVERLARWCLIQADHCDDHAAVSRSKAVIEETPHGYHAEMVGDYEAEAADYRAIASLLRSLPSGSGRRTIDAGATICVQCRAGFYPTEGFPHICPWCGTAQPEPPPVHGETK